MHREVQGRGRGGGLSQKAHHNKQIDSPSHPSNKVVRLQKSWCRQILEFKPFSREKSEERKKKKKKKKRKKGRKIVQDTPLESLLINVWIFYLISDWSSMNHEVAWQQRPRQRTPLLNCFINFCQNVKLVTLYFFVYLHGCRVCRPSGVCWPSNRGTLTFWKGYLSCLSIVPCIFRQDPYFKNFQTGLVR